MPERVSAWAVYEPFQVADGRQIFVGITSDQHWQRFCAEVGREDLARNPAYATNNDRIAARPQLIPILRELFAAMSMERATAICEKSRIPFAAIARPEDLFHDPHLEASQGLMPTTLPGGVHTRLPKLPVTLKGVTFAVRRDPPAVGEDTMTVLAELGFDEAACQDLIRQGVVTAGGRS